jgi:hypothetical protein
MQDCQNLTPSSRILAEARAHLEEMLDQALEDSFPASDPIEVARVS